MTVLLKKLKEDQQSLQSRLVKNKKFVSMREKNLNLIRLKGADGDSTPVERRRKSVATTTTATQFHGPDGLLGDGSIERDILSNIALPTGLASVLPAYATTNNNPRYGVLNGFNEDDLASEPDTPCDDAPTGTYEMGVLDNVFGKMTRDTNPIQVTDVVKMRDRNDTELRLIGEFLGRNMGNLDLRDIPVGDLLNDVVQSEMAGAALLLQRLLARMLWMGDPINSNVGGGYKEFRGLDMQITTGIVNADTLVAMEIMDSIVLDTDFTDLSGVFTVNGFDLNIAQVLSDVFFYLTRLAEDTGMGPVTWALVMRPQAWRALSELYPCLYNANTCSAIALADGASVNVLGNDMVRARDEYRSQMYLPINGVRVRIIEDTGIPEDNSETLPADLLDGQFSSKMYFVPLTIRGGFPVTYIEYLDMRKAAQVGRQIPVQKPFWTNDGKYLWAVEFLNYCLKMKATLEPRVLLRTPQLAAKVGPFVYSPTIALRSPVPGEPGYLT